MAYKLRKFMYTDEGILTGCSIERSGNIHIMPLGYIEDCVEREVEIGSDRTADRIDEVKYTQPKEVRETRDTDYREEIEERM